MSLSKRFILLLNFMLAFPHRDSLVYVKLQLHFMSFAFLLELYDGSLTLSYQPYNPSLTHVYPSRAFLHIFCSLITPFIGRRPFPRVSLSCMYLLALSIGMFNYLELVFLSPNTCLLLYLYYKALLFFFNIFKISKKFQKK